MRQVTRAYLVHVTVGGLKVALPVLLRTFAVGYSHVIDRNIAVDATTLRFEHESVVHVGRVLVVTVVPSA